MNSRALIKFEQEEEDEKYYDRSLKEEPYDQTEDSFECKHEISVKSEPVDPDCISELYVDHQIKEEIDIGPTEFLKQDTGTFYAPVISKTIYRCTICNETFKYKIALNKHKLLEHNNNTQNQNKNTVVISHFFHQAKNKKNKYSSKLKKLMKHLKNEFGSITCGVCLKQFATLNTLRNHMKKCPVVREKYEGNNEIRPNSHKTVVLKNEVTEKVFIKKEKVDKHVKKRVYKDNIEKYFIKKDKSEIILEMQDHSHSNDKTEGNYENNLRKEEKYKENSDDKIDKKSKEKCPKCFKTFTLKNNLSRHIRNVHSSNEHRKYPCDQCNMSFSRSDYLIKHKLYKHSLVKNNELFNCKCGSKFRDKSRLKRHAEYYCKLDQKQEKTLICDQCDRRFSNKVILNEHLKRHANAKILICDFCEEILPQKYLLIRHLQRHMKLPEVMYNCQICGKNFVRSFSLKKHLISHTGKKPFSCKFCGRGFQSRWGCLNHEKYLCQIMDETFNQH